VKLPRNVTGRQLAKALETLGYAATRQRGSHTSIWSPKSRRAPPHLPDHRPIKPGLLNRLLKDVAEHHGMSRDELIEKLRL